MDRYADSRTSSLNKRGGAVSTTLAASFAAVLALAGCSSPDQAAAPLTPTSSPAAPSAASAVPATQRFLDGVQRPEDLIAIPGTSWVLASGQPHDDVVGRLLAVDADSGRVSEVWPASARPAAWDRSAYPDCPGEPAAGTAPHGINLRSTGPAHAIVYAVAHGPRESVEVFDMDSSGAQPVLTWIGCAALPPNTSGNGVTPLPGGEGFVVTNFSEPNTDPFALLFAGQNTGDVRAWRSGSGWSTVAGSGLGGPNGLEISSDGATLYVSAWAARQVVRIPLAGGPANAQAQLPFQPDNLRWSPAGTLLVTGQDFDNYDQLTKCAGQGSDCPVGYQIIEIDPTTMTPSSRFTTGDPAFGLATVAAPVGDEVWVGNLGSDRIARVRL
jgi:hypothetical protein